MREGGERDSARHTLSAARQRRPQGCSAPYRERRACGGKKRKQGETRVSAVRVSLRKGRRQEPVKEARGGRGYRKGIRLKGSRFGSKGEREWKRRKVGEKECMNEALLFSASFAVFSRFPREAAAGDPPLTLALAGLAIVQVSARSLFDMRERVCLFRKQGRRQRETRRGR